MSSQEKMRERVQAALAAVVSPEMVGDIHFDKSGRVTFTLEVDPDQGRLLEPLRRKAETAVAAVAGVTGAVAVLTAETSSPPAPPLVLPAGRRPGGFSHKISEKPVAPGVRHIVAVTSGKGGVGKSTVSVNLAAALAQLGKRAGLLDADIYGASQPRMTGVRARPALDDSGMIIPLEAQGLKIMSMGFFVDPLSPVIWRGPMVHAALQQLLRDVAWGDLDVLVVDLPPGTGDIHLSLAQHVRVAGAVVVSTPQAVALSEARKAIAMFKKTGVPVLGMVENMSYHTCTQCGHQAHFFDHGHVRTAAADEGVPFLAEIPLLPDVRETADAGRPLDHAAAETFLNLASRVWASLPVG